MAKKKFQAVVQKDKNEPLILSIINPQSKLYEIIKDYYKSKEK